ncbi:MAG: xanthine dehydrogenase family protein molybdopterin-binding subunit [Deltaproteobacteria bacterium]|nr:xanthine dehydrogenase family protein molybdopterin-binding subunit [Deltaproteobacteria bacterium]
MEQRCIGTSVPRVDALEKVTGEARYVADLSFPGMLHAKLLRSPHAHARIVRIEKAAAAAMPGVHAVATGKDLPWWVGECIRDQRPMAVETARFAGEPVAAVVASSEDAALAALEAIRVDYEPLPAVLDARAALAPGAPLVHPDLGTYHVLPGFRPSPGTNVFHHYFVKAGDVTKGLARAAVVVEQEYEFPHLMHTALENHGCLARYTAGGRLEVHAGAQSPFTVRNVVAEAFGLPRHRVSVRGGYLGGGFGGKSDATVEPLTCALARLCPGRWVRLILDREESFVGSVLGRGFRGRYRYGLTRRGRLVAADIDLLMAGGAYSWTAVNILPCAGHNGIGPYFVPDLEIHARGLYTNTPPVGAYRGYGHPDSQFMAERHMDLCARAVGMDPVAFRLKNLLGKSGKKNPLGQRVDSSAGDLEGCIKLVAQDIGMATSPEGIRAREAEPSAVSRPAVAVGRGLACLMKSPGQATNAFTTVVLKFNEDGTVHVISAVSEMGQGVHTAIAQIAADLIEIPVEKVYVPQGTDTDYSPYDWQTVASRATWMQGRAIAAAWEKARKELRATAAKAFGVPVAKVDYRRGTLFVRGDESRALPLEKVCHGYVFPDGHAVGGPVLVAGHYVPHATYADEQTGRGELATSWTFGCQGAEVEVDLRTGEVTVLRFSSAIDVGRAVNPELAKAQVIGAVVFGLGGALTETVTWGPRGEIRNASMTDYKVPTPEDVRGIDFRVHLLETPVPGDPVGSRCLAEHGAVAVAPAIANAVADATGVDFFDVPLAAERVFLALQARAAQAPSPKPPRKAKGAR